MKLTINILIMILFTSTLQANLRKPKFINVKIFYSQTDTKGQNAEIKGKIISFSRSFDTKIKSLQEHIGDKTKISVRLFDNNNINVGDKLYVINQNNLIVSRFMVTTIHKSKSFGYMLVGKGNFRLSNIGDCVVKKTEHGLSRQAYIHTARGNYFHHTQQTGRAIKEYKTALTYDANNPEAHIALGSIYASQKMYDLAYFEYKRAYNNFESIYDNEDKFLLLRGLIRIKFWEIYYSDFSSELKMKFREEGILFCQKALSINPLASDVHYYLGVFYYRNTPQPKDAMAKDHLVKAVTIKPDFSQAYAALAELYLLNNKKEKAGEYARQALKFDNRNQKAAYILKQVLQK